MSASLFVLIPVVLLVLVTALCFTGCVVPNTGLPDTPAPYRDAIGTEPTLIAYWPLDDLMPKDNSPPIAHDLASHPAGQNQFDGNYTGTFALQKDGIVPGDEQDMARFPCASFGGGRVEVLFHQELNASSFTVECWVRPTSGGAQQAVVASAFVDGRPNPTANAGYALVATTDNFWSAQIGIGTTFVPVTSKDAIMLDGMTTYYLAMTFDGGKKLTLFVGIAGGAFTKVPPVTLDANQTFQSEAPGMTATQLFIGMGRPDLATSMQYPFNGLIQDVAFYSPALATTDIQKHFALGSQGS